MTETFEVTFKLLASIALIAVGLIVIAGSAILGLLFGHFVGQFFGVEGSLLTIVEFFCASYFAGRMISTIFEKQK